MLLRQFANHEKQDDRDHEHREAGYDDQISGLLAPIGQRRCDSRGGNDGDWKIGQCAGGSQPVLTVQRAGQTHRSVVGP